MATDLQTLDSLPRHSASQVKNKWGEVVRQVNRSGVAAVTNHSTVEMVLMPAAEYDRLRGELGAPRSGRAHSMN
ncbi:MAG: type II toxin-antitoxin system prevent-host-death family antitoxin [Proteobacteria bacterium]|nr:type II toxin-antitoxin system prevent-host-death family antitoxin [Pseudomonadota bacterium]